VRRQGVALVLFSHVGNSAMAKGRTSDVGSLTPARRSVTPPVRRMPYCSFIDPEVR